MARELQRKEPRSEPWLRYQGKFTTSGEAFYSKENVLSHPKVRNQKHAQRWRLPVRTFAARPLTGGVAPITQTVETTSGLTATFLNKGYKDSYLPDVFSTQWSLLIGLFFPDFCLTCWGTRIGKGCLCHPKGTAACYDCGHYTCQTAPWLMLLYNLGTYHSCWAVFGVITSMKGLVHRR